MVNMGMRQEHKLDIRPRHRRVDIFIDIDSLFHAAVYCKLTVAHLQIMAASCYLMRSSAEKQFHKTPPFIYRYHLLSPSGDIMSLRNVLMPSL